MRPISGAARGGTWGIEQSGRPGGSIRFLFQPEINQNSCLQERQNRAWGADFSRGSAPAARGDPVCNGVLKFVISNLQAQSNNCKGSWSVSDAGTCLERFAVTHEQRPDHSQAGNSKGRGNGKRSTEHFLFPTRRLLSANLQRPPSVHAMR